MAAEPTRRVLIAAAAAGSLGLTGSLAGCQGIAALGPVPAVPPDVITLARTIAFEQALIGRYRAAASQLSGGQLAVVRVIAAEHEAHLRELRSHLSAPSAAARSKLPGTAPALPDGTGLAALIAAEQAAAARLTSELLAAPAALAQLLASIAASEAAHVAFLRRAGSGAGR